MMKKALWAASIAGALVLPFAGTALADPPDRPVPGLNVAAVKNSNANPNACWGQDRAYYASGQFFPDNMDIKQSFPGDVAAEKAAWIATYC